MLAKSFTSLILSPCLTKNDAVFRNFSVTAKGDIVKIQSGVDFKEKVLKSKIPVVVDFCAEWCNPCKLLTPRLESIIAENKGKVVLAKVDIDKQTDLALDYDVSSIPVLLAIKNGKVQKRLVGLQDTDKLRKWIQQLTAEETKAKLKT